MELKNILRDIGLTEGESQVYIALLELGTSKVGEIINKSKISSSKVYEILERLTLKGLVSNVLKDNVKQYDATPPERLIDFLEEKKENISENQEKIMKMLPEIKMKRKSKEKNHVVVYTGLQGPKIALKETIEAGKKGEELMGYGTDEDPYKDHLPEFVEQYYQDQIKYNIKWRLLFNRKWKSPSPRAEIRYLKAGFVLPIRIMIYGDKVAIVDFDEPITTIIIDKKAIADNFKKQFEYFWKIAKK